ncbi:MAG: HI0074 family nucleotidyltransferase substrate-binding subunit [Candidatus Aenigmarchaeota archaeon]|nr:HI0074 family nucleotidyltransferase substrate-binding subunit [Candidatus Aenigmarchaeota archaeon]
MEQTERFKYKHLNYSNALEGFNDLLKVDLSEYTGVVLDGLKNGQIQKFEYCTELTWKIIKSFLQNLHMLELPTPKLAIKAFYTNNFVDEKAYELLINMLEDRNKLSHIYNEEDFNKIHIKLGDYLNGMISVDGIIKNYISE